jgi:hypothetical protein
MTAAAWSARPPLRTRAPDPATASAAGESEAGSRALGELAVEDPDRRARRLGLCLEQVSELRDGARGKLRSSRRKHPLAACVCGWGCSC